MIHTNAHDFLNACWVSTNENDFESPNEGLSTSFLFVEIRQVLRKLQAFEVRT